MTKTFEELAVEISVMPRKDLIRAILNFRGTFKMDFTEDFLGRLTDDRLRHIYIAAIMTWQCHGDDQG